MRSTAAKQTNFPEMGVSLEEKIAAAIELLKEQQPDNPYYGCFSGGKDSIVIKQLALLAGIETTWNYNVTTIDPPPLIRYIKKHHRDINWIKPKKPFFYRMKEKARIPMRRPRNSRWCCEEYKEQKSPRGAVLIMGIRAEESRQRAASWQEITFHRRSKTFAIAPILHWSSNDIWEFIDQYDLPYCELYDQGFDRLGCVGCPLTGKAKKKLEFERWPRYEEFWKNGFRFIWEKRAGSRQKNGKEWFGSAFFNSWEEMFNWWLSDKRLPGDDSCQLDMWK